MTFVTVYDIDCVVLVLILSHGRPKTICIMKNISYESLVTYNYVLIKLNLNFFLPRLTWNQLSRYMYM